MVSVIIPVFETEEFIEQCLDSVIAQTFDDLEIIIIMGDSNDKCPEICNRFAQIDNRIRIVRQKKSGAGDARNQGVAEAKGEYICFVDADDWVEPDYVEKMFDKMVSDNVDIVECDFYWEENGCEHIGGNSPYARIGLDFIRKLAAPACWKQMYRKSFWDREKLCFSNTVAEDLFLYSIMYRVCDGYFFLGEPLYHYRIRNGSFTDSAQKDVEKYKELFSVFEMLSNEYKKREFSNSAFEELYRELTPHANMRFRAIVPHVDDKTAEQLKRYGASFFRSAFSQEINSLNMRVVAMGGYSLGRISNYITAADIGNVRFSFSSIISIMSDKNEKHKPMACNDYRQKMLDKDFQGTLKSSILQSPPDLLLIDLVEERYDILECNGCYYTYSDALDGLQNDLSGFRIISRMSDECEKIWEESCDCFIDLIGELDERCKVVLVEDYLSENAGNIYNKYKKFDKDVSEINKKLSRYYKYLENRSDRIDMIRFMDIPDHLKYTDEAFKYGVLPEHYNEYYFSYVADRVMDLL